jgi:hypothetical protein
VRVYIRARHVLLVWSSGNTESCEGETAACQLLARFSGQDTQTEKAAIRTG